MSSTLEFASTKKIPISISSKSGIVDMPSIENMWADNKLKKCLIVSAFTDIEWIENVVEILKEKTSKKAIVQIFLDRGACKYQLKTNKERLDCLAKQIKRTYMEDSGIYLVSCEALFHSKMIYSESMTNIKVIIGSINFTQRAFEKNEEIALIESYRKPPIERSRKKHKSKKKRGYTPSFISPMLLYIQNLTAHAEQIPCNFRGQYKTLRNRLLDGYLFKRTNEIDPFVFHLNLPQKTLKRLSKKDEDVVISGDVSKLDKYLKDLKENSVSIKKLLETHDEVEIDGLTKQERAKLKSYSIESSYGFWVPREYYDEVIKSFEKSKENKEKKLDDSIKMLESYQNTIENNFYEFLKSIQEKLKGPNGKLSSEDNKIIERLKTSWIKWFDKLRVKFCIPYKGKNDEGMEKYEKKHEVACKKLKDKLSSNLFGYPMPNLWDDAETADEFESSILESIEYLLHRVGKKTTIIKDLIEDVICDTQEDIKNILINHEFKLPSEKKQKI